MCLDKPYQIKGAVSALQNKSSTFLASALRSVLDPCALMGSTRPRLGTRKNVFLIEMVTSSQT